MMPPTPEPGMMDKEVRMGVVCRLLVWEKKIERGDF